MKVGQQGFAVSARRLACAGAWLAIWQLVSRAVGSPLLLPGPLAVLRRIVELASTWSFWSIMGTTLGRALVGLCVGLVLAVSLGAAAYVWSGVRELLRPLVAVLRSTPIVCVIVLLLMWLGSRGVPAAAAFLVAFPPVYFATLEGLSREDAEMGELLQVFCVPRARRVLAHTWPGLVPYLAAACEVACGTALKAAVAAELIGTPLGSVGERIYQAKLLLETADVLAWTLDVIVVSAAVTRLFVRSLRASGSLAPRVAVWAASRARPPQPPAPAEVVLAGVCAGYGRPAVLRGVTHRFARGTRTVLTDASGVGKTTLLRVVAGLLKPAEGVVETARASVVFQDTRLVNELSALDNVRLVAVSAQASSVRTALTTVLPGVDLEAPVSALSGGQRRRVELVRALVAPSSIVLLDEPFASLDAGSREACCQFVDAHLGGRTLVMASHDPADAVLLNAQVHALGSMMVAER